MKKKIYFSLHLNNDNEYLTGTKEINCYIIKNDELKLVFSTVIDNNEISVNEIGLMLKYETYKDIDSEDYNEDLINYLTNTNYLDVAIERI